MRYFALYQREFSGKPHSLSPNSHVVVDTTSADDLEEVFARFQAEEMNEKRLNRVTLSSVHHTSMSVGDYLITETGACSAVTQIGFQKAGMETLGTRTELALHLLALGLEQTPGWVELFEEDPARLCFAILERLRNDPDSVVGCALKSRLISTPLRTEL